MWMLHNPLGEIVFVLKCLFYIYQNFVFLLFLLLNYSKNKTTKSPFKYKEKIDIFMTN